MHTSTNITEDLFRLLREKGAKLIGIADLSGITEGTLTTGISVAVPVPVIRLQKNIMTPIIP